LQGAQPMTDEERKLKQQKAMADPEIQGILTDPIMRQVRGSNLRGTWCEKPHIDFVSQGRIRRTLHKKALAMTVLSLGIR